MSKQEILETIKRHLEQAEADLKACGRGKNYGRVEALKALISEIALAELSSR